MLIIRFLGRCWGIHWTRYRCWTICWRSRRCNGDAGLSWEESGGAEEEALILLGVLIGASASAALFLSLDRTMGVVSVVGVPVRPELTNRKREYFL